MQKNYIAPHTEVMQLSSELMQATIGVVHHSGGGGGFTDETEIW